MHDYLDDKQRKAVEALLELKRICDRNCIKFFLMAGSCLGAVRHKGMIPWDDDIDVGFLQQDLEKLKSVIQKELGNGFSFNTSEKMNDVKVTSEGKTTFEYLKSIWKDNGGDSLINEIGQMKSVTGEAWVHVHYSPAGSFDDPFNIYDKGRMELLLIPTSAVFPDWNPHRRGELLRLLITYQIGRASCRERV